MKVEARPPAGLLLYEEFVMIIRPIGSFVCGFAAAFLLMGLGCAAGQTPAGPVAAPPDGVKFVVAASLKTDPSNSEALKMFEAARASLEVTLRISAHANESRYFGDVKKTFDAFDPNKGSGEVVVWEETACHQLRGMPKTSVVGLTGSVTTDNRKVEVDARSRLLGKKLPGDEISQASRLAVAAPMERVTVLRSRTLGSHLAVDVRIQAFPCRLDG